MSDKIKEMLKKVIEAKKEKGTQQGNVLRPDQKNSEKASTRRKKHR